MFFLFLLFVVLPIISIIVISNGPDKQPSQIHSYERAQRYYDDLDDDWDDDRETEAYFEGYQQGRLDSQSERWCKQEKTESESFWKPLSDYLNEYDYYCPDCDEDLIDGDCEHTDDWLG